ncbi:DUF805 domain-containing protein [Saccharophagus degradans]|uniref:DUF805 domain-containing protein n=1 Tax=Saccharophagus degradans TaxID=86304 RepID=UPI002477E56B|nr:DUF805 domain-containing protein [Saccharophagus degradans]WGO98175.1 DUF805 domain-containing protein [Saccharophagus degradans]
MTETLNPYQAPQGDLDTGVFAEGEVALFKASTRIGRLRYLSRACTFGILSYLALGITAGIAAAVGGVIAAVFWLLFAAIVIGVIAVSIIFGIQRLHDLNQSGWLILLNFIPIANLVMMIFLIFVPGTQGVNKWGHKPPANTTKHWVGALLPFIGIFVIGILAAISIPAYQDYIERSQSQETIDWSE